MTFIIYFLGFWILPLVSMANDDECFDEGFDYSGNNLLPAGQYRSTPTAEKCQEKCQNTNGCKYWTWDRNWKSACWMKTSMSRKIPKRNLVSGPRICTSDSYPPSQPSYSLPMANNDQCFDEGYDYSGNNVLPEGQYRSTPTAQKCQEKCQNTNGCKYWTWDRTWHNACWMKTSLTGKRVNQKLTSGPRDCTSGGSWSPPEQSYPDYESNSGTCQEQCLRSCSSDIFPPPAPSRSGKKKGVAIDPKKFRCGDLQKFTNIGWYYSWGTHDPVKKCNGVHIEAEFVPMIWGKKANLPSLDGYDTVLGFNEPNHKGQANMSPQKAAQEWRKLQRAYPDKKLVSPCPAPGGYVNEFKWFDDFFKACSDCRVDYLATHSYSGNAAHDIKFLNKLYQRYGKKIWFTEFAVPSTQDPRRQKEYMKEILPWLESSEAIWRYSWFVHRFSSVHSGPGWWLDRAISLMDQHSSQLTDLGQFYNNF